MSTNPILYYLPELDLFAYQWNDFWYDATNLVQVEPLGNYDAVMIHEFTQEPLSDLVFVRMNQNWILFQTSGEFIHKLSEHLSSPGAKVIDYIVTLVSPYGSKVGFNDNRFRDLVNIKTLGISLI